MVDLTCNNDQICVKLIVDWHELLQHKQEGRASLDGKGPADHLPLPVIMASTCWYFKFQNSDLPQSLISAITEHFCT